MIDNKLQKETKNDAYAMISTNDQFLYYFTDFGLKKMSLEEEKIS